MDERTLFGIPDAITTMIASLTLAIVGLAWLHRIFDADQLLGRATWRYRDREHEGSLVEAIVSLIDTLFAHTFGWWVTRIEFALATGALLLATLVLGTPRPPALSGPLVVPALALGLLGYAGILVGIRWMRRIYLSPLELDAEVRWRYRD